MKRPTALNPTELEERTGPHSNGGTHPGSKEDDPRCLGEHIH